MYISKCINLLNNKNNVCNNINSKNKNSNEYINRNLTSQSSCNLSFGSGLLTKAAQLVLSTTVSKAFKIGKYNYEINNVNKYLNNYLTNSEVRETLEVAIDIASKIGNRTSCKYTKYGELINSAAKHAKGLSDSEFVNVDVKRRFLRAVFLSEEGGVPDDARTLFKQLDNKTYGDFKIDLIETAVYKHDIPIYDTDDLLGNLVSQSRKNEIKNKVEQIIKDRAYVEKRMNDVFLWTS